MGKIRYYVLLFTIAFTVIGCRGIDNNSASEGEITSETIEVPKYVAEEATGDASLAEYIVVCKESKRLKLYDSENRLICNFAVAVGRGEGDKQYLGDMCTPEGEFIIEQIQSSRGWLYDSGDGNGPVEGYYGDWFMRLSSSYIGIGIHGTSDIASIGRNSTEGSIRLANYDLDSLRSMVREGMTVRIVEMDMRERIAVATEVRVEESSSEINDIEPVVEDVNEVKEVADNQGVDDVTAQGAEQVAEYSAEHGKEVWHTVADGELLGRIARSYGTTISKIKQLNPDIDVDRISIGQRILISDGTSPVKSPTKVEAKKESVEAKAADGDGEVWYTLQPGDLVGRVAIRYGTTAKRVQELNPDINIDRVRDGQRIRVK